jgi:hypothetical protein
MLVHFGEHTCKGESCHGKRPNAQQSRSQETEAGEKGNAHHLAFGLASHSGDTCFVGDTEKALSPSDIPAKIPGE